MEELRYKKLDEFNIDSKLIAVGAFKPIKSVVVIVIAGIALMLINNLIARILGLFFIAMALLVFFFVTDKKTIDVYETGCLIYNSKDSTLAYFLDYEDVVEWDVVHEGGHDTIEFTLIDGNKAIVDTFQASKIFSALDKVIHDKNRIAIQAKKNKEFNISAPDALRNLLNRKK